MTLSDSFFDIVEALLKQTREVNSAALKSAGVALGECIAGGGVLHVFGSGHSQIVAREVVNRAGGYVPVSQIVDPTGGWAEVLPGYGEKLFYRYAQAYAPRAGDFAVVISNSGVNPSPVGLALACAAAGMRVATVSNVTLSKTSVSKHESGKRLFECGEWAFDNCGVPGDAALSLKGAALKTGSVSTFPGAMILDLLVLESMQVLEDRGLPVPILQSANTGGREYNDRMSKMYQGRICRPV
ncbi:MAG TPA: sugar isomerase domain-containing protein [Opitutales bacterium]|nr:sugar isomerase domain-containing protein [Opitutales bacterium]